MYNLPISSSSNLPASPLTEIATKDPRAGGAAFYDGAQEEGINNRRKNNPSKTRQESFLNSSDIGQLLDVIA